MLVVHNGIRKEFLVLLDRRIIEISSNQALDIKDGSRRILRRLILGGVSDESGSILEESYIGRSDAVSLLVRAHVHAIVPPHGNTRVCGPQIDSYTWAYDLVIRATTQLRQDCQARVGRRRFRGEE
mmetsp:Transcript_76899/g.215753  ORF Transcript_76899/g.215753 Transcript_76899/m.215753 type:complete len:126 (+) Transcript_76899:1698-2075(+)